MISQNPTLPPLFGKIVTIHDVRTTHLNGRTGKVIGFHEKKKRFMVKLGNSTKLLKGCNLDCNLECDPHTRAKLLSLRPVRDLKQGLKIFRWLEENRSTPLAWEAEIWEKQIWCANMFRLFLTDPNALSAILNEQKKLVTDSKHLPYLHVYAKIELALNSEKNYDVLWPLVEEHYGLLPHVASALFRGTEHVDKKIELYFQVKKFMEEKNFNPEHCNLLDHYETTLNHVILMGIPNTKQPVERLLKEIDFLREKIFEFGPMHSTIDLAIGKTYLMQSDFETALTHLKQFLKSQYAKTGTDSALISEALGVMFHCYVNLGRKKKCKTMHETCQKILASRGDSYDGEYVKENVEEKNCYGRIFKF